MHSDAASLLVAGLWRSSPFIVQSEPRRLIEPEDGRETASAVVGVPASSSTCDSAALAGLHMIWAMVAVALQENFFDKLRRRRGLEVSASSPDSGVYHGYTSWRRPRKR